MTLKYESELLFDLMKRDGDDAPSDVLPYESELKEKYLNQVVGAYPKLQDYRPEWLNYNLYHHIPSDFPVESVSNVTSASFNNVVPYAYGSAILSGNTLVNLVGEKRLYNNNKGINPTLFGWEFMLPYNLTKGKTYLAVFNATGTIDETNSKVYLMDNGFDSETGNGDYPVDFKTGYNVVKCVASGDNHKVLRIRTAAETLNDLEVSDVMLIEYQDGMENWDIPYFEGMQSVKMPVLTTSNEDGTKTNILTVNEEIELCEVNGTHDELNLLTGEVTQRIGEIVLDGSEEWNIISSEDGVNTSLYRTNNIIVDDLAKVTWGVNHGVSLPIPYRWNTYDNDEEGVVFTHPSGHCYLRSTIRYLSEFKTWLSQNPITIQYELATPVVKTVDLTVTNQDGNTTSNIRPIEGTMHVNTSSQTLPPLLDMSVPVEATTQNLMSFANIEGEE